MRGRNRPELRADERHDPIELVAMLLDGGVEVVPACGGPSRAGSDVPGARDSRSAASGGDQALAMDDFVDAPRGHGDSLREAVRGGVSPLAVVGDLDAGGSGRCPGEAVAPLVLGREILAASTDLVQWQHFGNTRSKSGPFSSHHSRPKTPEIPGLLDRFSLENLARSSVRVLWLAAWSRL